MAKTPIAVLGIDLGKNSCSLAGLDAAGAVIMRRRMTREGTIKFVATLPACVVAMEACCGPISWAGPSPAKATRCG